MDRSYGKWGITGYLTTTSVRIFKAYFVAAFFEGLHFDHLKQLAFTCPNLQSTAKPSK